MLVLLCISFILTFLKVDLIEASTFKNAYSFYGTYKNDMAFLPGDNKEGEIYYATRGKKAITSGTQYTTLGWKVTIKSSAGKTVSIIYYKLGGNYMTRIDTRVINGYEYTLYRVTLDNLKKRMSQEAKDALRIANCTIFFDACLALKKDGIIQGGMTDSGPTWGKVYTTYNGIANAADWSVETKQTLKSYFSKTIDEMFYTVRLTAGDGIAKVSGQGKYCFGTEVVITAIPKTNYYFHSWSGSEFSINASHSFVIHNDVSFIANARKMNLMVCFFKGDNSSKIPYTKRYYFNDTLGQTLPHFDWKKEGYTQIGWSLNEGDSIAKYSITHPVSQDFIDKHLPTVNLYAVWDKAPEIKGEHIYVSLEDAKKGVITEEFLAKYIRVIDLEDGVIFYGKNEKNSLLITNYLSTDFTHFTKEGTVTETFCAKDSAGNVTKKSIMVHVVDTTIYDKSLIFGTPRFISSKYYKDNTGHFVDFRLGGLMENSIWRLDESYSRLLDTVLQ